METIERSGATMLGRLLLLWIAITMMPRTSSGDDAAVRVDLLGVIEPTNEIVTIADVARITGGTAFHRRRIEKLDLAKLSNLARNRRISKKQVELRILLAGYSEDRFRATGAEQVLLRVANTGPITAESTEQTLLDYLQPEIASRLGVPIDDVQLRLTRPMSKDLDEAVTAGRSLGHFLPQKMQPGQTNAKIGIYDNGKLLRTESASIEIQVTARVAVARHALEVGTMVGPDDVIEQRRLLSKQLANNIPTDVIGMQIRKNIEAGEILSDLVLQKPGRVRKEIVIRSRDIIEVVAKQKTLQVKISGAVALQQGAIGDLIRVKNPDSGKILTARVIDAGIVEIRL